MVGGRSDGCSFQEDGNIVAVPLCKHTSNKFSFSWFRPRSNKVLPFLYRKVGNFFVFTATYASRPTIARARVLLLLKMMTSMRKEKKQKNCSKTFFEASSKSIHLRIWSVLGTKCLHVHVHRLPAYLPANLYQIRNEDNLINWIDGPRSWP